MQRITSPDNHRIRQIRQLKQRRGREKQGVWLLEGPNPIREALTEGQELLQIVFCEVIGPEAGSDGLTAECSALRAEAEARGLNPLITDRNLFVGLTDTETPQGVLAVIRRRAFSPQEFFIQAAKRGGNLLILDRLQDPGNIGAVIRTADAAGFGGVIAVKGTGDIYAPKTVRASAGALLRLPVLQVQSGAEAVLLAGQQGLPVAAADPRGRLNWYEADLSRPVALAIGNEGNGLSEDVLEAADLRLAIFMREGAESLNAAAAAAILMFECVRQRHSTREQIGDAGHADAGGAPA